MPYRCSKCHADYVHGSARRGQMRRCLSCGCRKFYLVTRKYIEYVRRRVEKKLKTGVFYKWDEVREWILKADGEPFEEYARRNKIRPVKRSLLRLR